VNPRCPGAEAVTTAVLHFKNPGRKLETKGLTTFPPFHRPETNS